MRRGVFAWLALCVSALVLAGLAQPAASPANHVTADPRATARGERVSDRTDRVRGCERVKRVR